MKSINFLYRKMIYTMTMRKLETEFVKEFRSLLKPMKKELRTQLLINRNTRDIVRDVFVKHDIKDNFKDILLNKLVKALNGGK